MGLKKNAAVEILDLIGEGMRIKCAEITVYIHTRHLYGGSEKPTKQPVLLPDGYSETQYKMFLHLLNWEYDAWEDCMVLDGTVWFDDGSWLQREFHDCDEWWEWYSCPEIPETLRRNKEENQ